MALTEYELFEAQQLFQSQSSAVTAPMKMTNLHDTYHSTITELLAKSIVIIL